MDKSPASPGAEVGFGKAVGAIRASLGLSQADLAERAGMPASELDEFEKGGGGPTWEDGQRIAQGFGMPLAAIAVVAELLDMGLIEVVGVSASDRAPELSVKADPS